MLDWKHALHQAAYQVEEQFDRLRYQLKERLGYSEPIQIVPYRGFGSKHGLWLMGRVLEGHGLSSESDHDTVWQNLLRTYQRFETDEIPGVSVQARCLGEEGTAVTDEEGYFRFRFRPRTPPETFQPWYDVELELLDVPGMNEKPARATGHILVPPLDCDYGVISDVDDTVIQTNATSLLAMARTTFLHSAHTRLPFEGVAAFYQALQKGPRGDSHNPIFYVSSSPWNLYDLLEDFFELNGVPMGPFLLRDLGLDRDKFIKSGHHEHKLAQIERVLATYPDLLFILIGDSGQKDPEIYEQVVRDFPGRILTIYIRDVSPDARDEEVRSLARAAHDLSVEIRLVPDSGEAAKHAAEEGFIDTGALPSIMAEKAKDEGAPLA